MDLAPRIGRGEELPRGGEAERAHLVHVLREHGPRDNAAGQRRVLHGERRNVELGALDPAHAALLPRHRHSEHPRLPGRACQRGRLSGKDSLLTPLDAAGRNAVEAALASCDNEPRLLRVQPPSALHRLFDLDHGSQGLSRLVCESVDGVVDRNDQRLGRSAVGWRVSKHVIDRLANVHVPVRLVRRRDRDSPIGTTSHQHSRLCVAR
mmetsp:Transcript_6367/g.18938  ORF Transcript_6367/g.18938 Transcript_6367/m.18938 type:complete len:208 (-) Transcript_6367:1060-1683(-)